MISKFHVSNYKSIKNLELNDLGNVNVLIGTNGCGKSNILEAIATMAAAMEVKNVTVDVIPSLSINANTNLTIENFENRGIRISKPSLTVNSFVDSKNNEIISFEIESSSNRVFNTKMVPLSADIFSEWKILPVEYKIDDPTWKLTVSESNLNKILELIDVLKDVKSDIKVSFDVLNLEENLFFKNFCIFSLDTQVLRGLHFYSNKKPLGIYGEGLDILLASMSNEEQEELHKYMYLIDWLEDYQVGEDEALKAKGFKLGKSKSQLYFHDKFMQNSNNCLSSENANEGALHILFYLALVISSKTPLFFAIDNIETSLNPGLCRKLISILAELAVKHNKQIMVTTHNPAILDGMNLNDPVQRLYSVERNSSGQTIAKPIRMKPETARRMKLSEMWLSGLLGSLPKSF